MNEMLTKRQQLELLEITNFTLEQSRTYYSQHTISAVNVNFDLGGSIAGQYRPKNSLIRYNPHIAAKQYESFKARTVVHEVSHHVVGQVWGTQNRRVRPHGQEWQEVMCILGVENISRCHTYDLSGIKVKRQQRHSYQCVCRQHQISTTRHNRIINGMQYRCGSCKQLLVKID